MAKSIRKFRPSKPHPDFPLFPHATGRWAKKVRGKLHYFGPWDDSDGALNRWLDTKDDLLAGRTPRRNREGLAVKELSNRYLHAKRGRVETGELTEVTWTGYRITCQHILKFFGTSRFVEDLRPEDFEQYRTYLSKTNGLVGIRNQVRNARMVFSYAFKAGLIDRPVIFGPEFTAPTARALRKARTPRMFEASQIRQMLEHADATMRAMVLLGVNAAFGNSDVTRLPLNAINLNAGWITYRGQRRVRGEGCRCGRRQPNHCGRPYQFRQSRPIPILRAWYSGREPVAAGISRALDT
jgi:hypothetical protein